MIDDTVEIPGFPGYRVSRSGEIWSCRYSIGQKVKKWRLLSPPAQKHNGYQRVSLRKDGRTIRKYVHAVVLEAFIGPRPEGMEACHADGCRTNNNVSNLRWDTAAGNNADRIAHGTSNRGSRQGRSKLKESDIPEIFAIRQQIPNATIEDIGIYFGVAKSTIHQVLAGKNWAWMEPERKLAAVGVQREPGSDDDQPY